jgi:hypothetical protein
MINGLAVPASDRSIFGVSPRESAGQATEIRLRLSPVPWPTSLLSDMRAFTCTANVAGLSRRWKIRSMPSSSTIEVDTLSSPRLARMHTTAIRYSAARYREGDAAPPGVRRPALRHIPVVCQLVPSASDRGLRRCRYLTNIRWPRQLRGPLLGSPFRTASSAVGALDSRWHVAMQVWDG